VITSAHRLFRMILPATNANPVTPQDRALDRTRRARITIAANIVARGLALLTVIASARLALGDLGAARFGIWMTIASLLLLITMFDFGVGNGLVGPVARAVADGDDARLARLVTQGFTVTGLIGLLLGGITITCSLLIPLKGLFPKMPASVLAEARQALLCFSILISASPALGAAGRMLAGMQRGYLVHIGNAIASCLTIVLLFWLGHSGGHSISAYVLATFGLVQVSALAMVAVLARDGLVRIHAFRHVSLAECQPLFQTGGLFFGLQLAVTFGWGLDQAFISSISGPAAVAFYAVAGRIFMLVSQPFYVLNAPLWPAYAEALHRGDRGFVRRTLSRSLYGTLSLSLLLSIVILWFGPMLWSIFTGGRLPFNATLLITFAIWTVVECSGNALATYLNGAHIVREQLVTMLAFVAVAIPLKLIVLTRFGVTWMPLATAICYAAMMILFYAIIYRRVILSPLTDDAWQVAD
jgi:O-antigen/teichoic acid export membrane protein